MGRERKDGIEHSEAVCAAAERSLGVAEIDGTACGVVPPAASARTLVHEVQPGFTLRANDYTCVARHWGAAELEPGVGCSVLLHGDGLTMEVEGYGPITRTLGHADLRGSSRPTAYIDLHDRTQRIAGASFFLRPDFFDRFGERISDDGLAALREFGSGDFRFENLPRSPRVLEIARRCLDHPYGGHLGELFLESSALAFVVEIARMLAQERKAVALIGRRHYDRVMEARAILDASLTRPPTTLELARRVGVNRTTLQANFKLATGTTIFGYICTQRLLMARELLIEHRLTVAEAAYRAGFASAPAFSVSYRRHFGHPPSEDAWHAAG